MPTQVDQPNRYAPPQARVMDAAGDEEHLANRGTRLAASIVDSLMILLMVQVPLMFGVGLQGLAEIGASSSPIAVYAIFGRGFTGAAGFVALIGLIVVAASNAYFVKKNGQSVGKKLFGIKVIRTDGSTASLSRIFWLRNVVNFVFGWIPVVGRLYGIIDALVIFSEPRRCIHDRIADTIVVKAYSIDGDRQPTADALDAAVTTTGEVRPRWYGVSAILLPLATVVRDDAGSRPGHFVTGQVPRRDRQVIDPA